MISQELSVDKSSIIIISQFWCDWFITESIVLAMNCSELYEGVIIDIKSSDGYIEFTANISQFKIINFGVFI